MTIFLLLFSTAALAVGFSPLLLELVRQRRRLRLLESGSFDYELRGVGYQVKGHYDEGDLASVCELVENLRACAALPAA